MDTESELVPFSIDTSGPFMTEALFPSRDDIVRWVRDVGKGIGVVVIILRSDKAVGKRGTRDKIIFGCKKNGNFSNNSRVIGSKKRNCPFKLRATYTVRDRGLRLRVRCGLHTHELLTTLTGSALFGRLTEEEEEKRVDEHTGLRVAPKDSMNALKKKFAGNVTSMPQLYRQRYIYRSSLKGPRTDIQELMRLIESEKFLCWSRKVEGTDVVSDIMWAHPTSIKVFRLFPNVLILDSTYKTNKYRIPLLEIVGVTSTEITFSVAFAYLTHERESHFTWALQMLKDLFDIHDLSPQVFLTDRDLGLMSDIYEVFPSSINLLCVWHITKNVKAKTKEYVHVDRQESMISFCGDGNCGFRSVAIGLGYGEESWSLIRQDLIQEITSHYDLYSELFGVQRLATINESLFVRGYGRQDKDKWLSMPEMGYIISTKYNVALVELSLKISHTYFPLRGSYSSTKSRSIISILHVNDIQWVHVALLPECPLPPVGLQWERFSSDEANSWLDPYMGRFQLWVSLASVPKSLFHLPKLVDLTPDSESD